MISKKCCNNAKLLCRLRPSINKGETKHEGILSVALMAELTPTPNRFWSPKVASEVELEVDEEGKISPQDAAVKTTSPTNVHKILAEFAATYILIFTGCGSIIVDVLHNISIVGIAIVWGLVVMVLVYTVGHISGAHFNPAVTIAFAVSRKFPWRQVPIYIGTQIVASLLATITLHVLYNKQVDLDKIVNGFSEPTTALEAIVWEFILAFILMFVICGVATDHRAVNDLSGVAVGGAILLNVIVAGKVTGASMNPARSIAPAVVSSNYKNLWVYIVAPILGATAGSLVYGAMQVPQPDKSEDTTMPA
ncbi:Aquaporin nip1-2 [Thalictrum thalictroides]|uniref:Aquaporin nip1-2 n=1 Tax=Thalictrum thalictroides TaxID=46969 RepID=A0A7J6UVB9_THATH|nr:Aquaporin nip1-2 [Thalictrum thalictroides]